MDAARLSAQIADMEPPAVKETDSLSEQIQRTFPDTRVVKTLNTMSAAVMVERPISLGCALRLRVRQ
jgi:predicted dinucleotide-binding enzyme